MWKWIATAFLNPSLKALKLNCPAERALESLGSNAEIAGEALLLSQSGVLLGGCQRPSGALWSEMQ